MENTITIGGWNVTITKEHKVAQVDPDGFKFSKIFCIGHAHWNKQPVYFLLAGGTRTRLKTFDTIEAMREEYSNHLADGWTPA